MNTYSPLPLKPVSGTLQLAQQTSPLVSRVNSDDAALNLMTDLTTTQAVMVRDIVPIDEALNYMKQSGVRLLFVLDNEQRLLGLVTSNDVLGEKPMRYLQFRDCTREDCAWKEILVRDIMVPVEAWQVLDYSAVKRARIGHIAATFKAAGRRHLLVVETARDGAVGTVRGLFSASRLEQQLQQSIDTFCAPANFAEAERVLAHPYQQCD